MTTSMRRIVFGGMADQEANAVAITGGTINGTTLGAITPAAGTFSILASTAAGTVGLFGVTAVVRRAAYVQTYATAVRTINPSATGAFTGIDNLQLSTPYAKVVDLNTLRTDMLQMAGLINSLIDDSQAIGVAQ